MKTNVIYEERQNNVKGYSGSSDYIKTDCPNPEDFEKVVKNAEGCMKIQDDFWKWKKKQKKELVNYYKGGYL